MKKHVIAAVLLVSPLLASAAGYDYDMGNTLSTPLVRVAMNAAFQSGAVGKTPCIQAWQNPSAFILGHIPRFKDGADGKVGYGRGTLFFMKVAEPAWVEAIQQPLTREGFRPLMRANDVLNSPIEVQLQDPYVIFSGAIGEAAAVMACTTALEGVVAKALPRLQQAPFSSIPEVQRALTASFDEHFMIEMRSAVVYLVLPAAGQLTSDHAGVRVDFYEANAFMEVKDGNIKISRKGFVSFDNERINGQKYELNSGAKGQVTLVKSP